MAIDMTVQDNNTQVNMESASVPYHVHDGRYYTEDEINTLLAAKLAANQGTANAGKAMVVGSDGAVTFANRFDIVSTVTRWGVMRQNVTETPSLTLPTPETDEPQEILYIFTAMTANATFTAPTGFTIFDEDIPMSTASSSITYTDLTVGSMYEVDFLVVSPTKISILKVEHTEV